MQPHRAPRLCEHTARGGIKVNSLPCRPRLVLAEFPLFDTDSFWSFLKKRHSKESQGPSPSAERTNHGANRERLKVNTGAGENQHLWGLILFCRGVRLELKLQMLQPMGSLGNPAHPAHPLVVSYKVPPRTQGRVQPGSSHLQRCTA